MVAKLVRATDAIVVANPPVLIYGEPFAGKTSLGQTLEGGLTLDFDDGSHRSSFRKDVLRGEDSEGDPLPLSWADCCSAEGLFADCNALVIDTVGHMIDSLSRAVIAESPKNGTPEAGLKIQGWGVVKNRFAAWVNRQRARGIQLCFVCHEKEDKDGDSRYYRPAIAGGSYSMVMQLCDLVGRLSFRGQTRILDFNPSDRQFGKNPAGWTPVAVPHLGQNPRFLQQLIVEASQVMGRISAQVSASARVIQEYQDFLAADPNLDAFNAKLEAIASLDPALRKQIRPLLNSHIQLVGWKLDQATKRYYRPQTLPEPVAEGVVA